MLDKRNKSHGNLIELAHVENRNDKADELVGKNNTSKLLSKNVLKRKRDNLAVHPPPGLSMHPAEDMHQDNKYMAKQSVIEENISDANLLNSFDDQMQKSIRPGEKFLKNNFMEVSHENESNNQCQNYHSPSEGS